MSGVGPGGSLRRRARANDGRVVQKLGRGLQGAVRGGSREVPGIKQGSCRTEEEAP